MIGRIVLIGIALLVVAAVAFLVYKCFLDPKTTCKLVNPFAGKGLSPVGISRAMPGPPYGGGFGLRR